jgi:putative transposase
MALKNKTTMGNKLIHHSDRGIQYCCSEYVSLLKQNAIQISMTENGDPLENPIAERVNGIIKQEYLSHYQINSQYQAMQLLESIIKRYNEQRPHQGINMLTPEVVHQKQLSVNKRWGMKNQITNIVNALQD